MQSPAPAPEVDSAPPEAPHDEREASVPRAIARLLEYAAGRHVALPSAATVELVDRPRRVAVPGLPPHCRGLVAWQERWIPLVDLALLISPEAPPEPVGHVLVVAWQAAPGQPLEHGALCAARLVQLAAVSDRQQCELPGDEPWWSVLAMACFEHRGEPVPVLDPARLFGLPLA